MSAVSVQLSVFSAQLSGLGVQPLSPLRRAKGFPVYLVKKAGAPG